MTLPPPFATDSFESLIARLVQACTDGLDELGQTIVAARPALEAGHTLGDIKGMTDEHFETLYGIVTHLCDADRCAEALPLTLQLVAHKPHDFRFALAAGHCLQRQDEHLQALALYGASFAAEATPLAALRLGQCHAALGDAANALSSFELAGQLCDVQGHDDPLRRSALDAADAARQSLDLSAQEVRA